MPRRSKELSANRFYHLYNRGNNKEPIFFEKENYLFFLDKFSKTISSGSALVHAFCLMPNHYHFLIELIREAEFQKQFGGFLISYVKSFNQMYQRVGHLFQGRFQAKPVDSDEYLIHLSRYIHLNPVFAELVKKGEEWEFSSYRDFVSKDEIWKFVSRDLILSNFGNKTAYREFVESFSREKFLEMQGDFWKEE